MKHEIGTLCVLVVAAFGGTGSAEESVTAPWAEASAYEPPPSGSLQDADCCPTSGPSTTCEAENRCGDDSACESPTGDSCGGIVQDDPHKWCDKPAKFECGQHYLWWLKNHKHRTGPNDHAFCDKPAKFECGQHYLWWLEHHDHQAEPLKVVPPPVPAPGTNAPGNGVPQDGNSLQGSDDDSFEEETPEENAEEDKTDPRTEAILDIIRQIQEKFPDDRAADEAIQMLRNYLPDGVTDDEWRLAQIIRDRFCTEEAPNSNSSFQEAPPAQDPLQPRIDEIDQAILDAAKLVPRYGNAIEFGYELGMELRCVEVPIGGGQTQTVQQLSEGTGEAAVAIAEEHGGGVTGYLKGCYEFYFGK